MYDNFHAYLVDTNLKTQASNMHEKSKEKVKKEFPYLFMEERYRTSSVSKFTTMRCHAYQNMGRIWYCVYRKNGNLVAKELL